MLSFKCITQAELPYVMQSYLIVVGVVQIFLLLFLTLFHLVTHCPLSRGRVTVVHRVISVTSRTDIRSCGETRSTGEHAMLGTLKQIGSKPYTDMN